MILRIITLPLFFLFHLLWALQFALVKSYLFLRFGGEFVTYYEHKKTITDIYEKLKTILPEAKNESD